MRSPTGRGGGGLRRRLPGDGCSGGRRQRKGATAALPGRRRSRVTVAPGRPSRVRPRRADRPSQEVIDPGPTSRDEGDDAHRIRYRLDCRRSRSQGQRSFRVADRPFADTFGRASSRRSLAGHDRPVSSVWSVTAKGWSAASRPWAKLLNLTPLSAFQARPRGPGTGVGLVALSVTWTPLTGEGHQC